MIRINRITVAAVFSLLAAIALGGCGSGNKEGASPGGSALFGGVATVGDTACNQCHSAVTEALTGEGLITQYQLSSPHNVAGLGCESCHGGGAGHNGVGPIPFSLANFTPNQKGARCATCHDGVQTLTVNGVPTVAPGTNSNRFEASNHATGTPAFAGFLLTTDLCVRCHTHEGAVLSNNSGFTGDGTVINNPANGPPFFTGTLTGFKCETCHQHGGGLRVVKAPGNVLWDPNGNVRVDQFDLCTGCHTFYSNNGAQLLVDGRTHGGVATGVVGQHETDWNRIIATTHFDNPNTGIGLATNVVEGYVVRRTSDNACYDCHGHEAKTETDPASAELTIHKEWAQSAHAGRLLTAKYTATNGSADPVLAAMAAGSIDDVNVGGPGWVHYNWDQTTGTGNRASCQKCHTATGISNYLADQAGYLPANNRFTHLQSWTAATGSPQNELLYCWGCHSNAGTGQMRNTTSATLDFQFNAQPIVITGVGKSVACVVCHGGRGSVSDQILNDAATSTRFVGHHAPTAGVMFSDQTHLGYEYPGLSYASPFSFVHDNIGSGLNGSGPCASCHMAGKSHSFEALEHDNAGVITAITNQALCNTCHATGGLNAPVTPARMTSLKAGYAQAATILLNYVNNVTASGFQNYLNLNLNANSAVIKTGTTFFTNGELAEDNAYGAYQNSKLNGDEPCAYVHNSIYTRRILFDSIDWMDNGVINGAITFDPVAFPAAAAWFNAPAGTATRP